MGEEGLWWGVGYIRDPLETGSNPGGKEGLKWEWNIVSCVILKKGQMKIELKSLSWVIKDA